MVRFVLKTFWLCFQIEVHEELADADKISANGSVPTSNSDQDAEDVALNGNGNGYQNGNCQEIRRSTIMFVIKSNQDLTKTASQQNGSKPSPIRGLISGNGKNNHVSTPELRDSNTSLHHAQRLVSKELNHFGMIYSGRLGVVVVDLCYFALFEDFSL